MVGMASLLTSRIEALKHFVRYQFLLLAKGDNLDDVLAAKLLHNRAKRRFYWNRLN